MSIEVIPVEQEFVALDLLLYRRFGARYREHFDRTLKLNPQLSEVGVFLPVGTDVLVEVQPPGTTPVITQTIRLWE